MLLAFALGAVLPAEEVDKVQQSVDAQRGDRQGHIEGRFEEIPKCWSCGGINFYKMSPEEVRSYLEENERLDLWPAYTTRMGLDESGASAAS